MVKKLKSATKKVQKKSFIKRITNAITGFFGWIWSTICRFAKWIWKIICMFWTWLCNINLVALLNLALLVSIIVLFSMLIIDVVSTKSTPVVVVNQKPIQSETVRHVKPRPMLPLRHSNTSNHIGAINVVPVKVNKVAIKQTPCHKNNIMGDLVVSNRSDAIVLTPGVQINGNLYIQNMRKYTLPCNVKINGNLFLRDLGVLQFCGRFTVTGNIYVSPRSSFGPLPADARIGGQVIL